MGSATMCYKKSKLLKLSELGIGQVPENFTVVLHPGGVFVSQWSVRRREYRCDGKKPLPSLEPI